MKKQSLILAALLTLGACASDTGPESDSQKGDQQGDFQFAFRSDKPGDYRTKTDHLGLSLVTTVLLNRSDDVNCAGAANQLKLLKIFQGLIRLHRMWADDIREAGFETCSMIHEDGQSLDEMDEPSSESILDYLTGIPCTLQKVRRRLPDGTELEPVRVLDLITPDFATIDVDQPGGFPNGRHLSDQVTDLILAMGLADLSKVRVDEVQLNPQENDVPFRDAFPYLAPHHPDIPQ